MSAALVLALVIVALILAGIEWFVKTGRLLCLAVIALAVALLLPALHV